MQEKELSPQEVEELLKHETKPDNAKEDKDEVLRLSVLEALSAYRDSIDAGDKPEMAKPKGIQKINELLDGEFNDVILPAIEQFNAELQKEPATPPPTELPVENTDVRPEKEETPEENREKLARAVEDAVQEFRNQIAVGSSIEKARGEAIIKFGELSGVITNTAEENQAANEELQKRLEELELAEKSKEAGEDKKERILKESMEAYSEAIANGKSPNEAENASMEKFRELTKDVERPQGIEMITELKNRWRQEKIKGKVVETPLQQNNAEAPTTEPKSFEFFAETANENFQQLTERLGGLLNSLQEKISAISGLPNKNRILQEISNISEQIPTVKEKISAGEVNADKLRAFVNTLLWYDSIEINNKESAYDLGADYGVEKSPRKTKADNITDGLLNNLENCNRLLRSIASSESEPVTAPVEPSTPAEQPEQTPEVPVIPEPVAPTPEEVPTIPEPTVEETPAVPEESPATPEVETPPLSREEEERLAEEMAKELGLEPKTPKSETETPPLTPEEATAIEAIAKVETVKDIAALPEETREKLGRGFGTWGFYVEEYKNKKIANFIEHASAKNEKIDSKSTFGRFLSSLTEIYRRDEKNAHKKIEEITHGDKHKISNIGYLTGNIVRAGRVLLDFTGYTIASPFRYVMMGAMMSGRVSEAAKEARFKNEEVIEKTRIEDINRAEEEAWKIYESAQRKAGDGEISKEELNKAFLENLPQDILNRLDSVDLELKPGVARRIFENISGAWIDLYVGKIMDKLDKAETDEEKQKILAKYEGKLKDIGRMVGDFGEIDITSAMARYLEEVAKKITVALSVETLVALPLEKLFDIKLWDSVSDVLGVKAEVASAINPQELKLTEELLGINSSDGINPEEAKSIGTFLEQSQMEGYEDVVKTYSDRYFDQPVSGTDKTVGEFLKDWAVERRATLSDSIDSSSSNAPEPEPNPSPEPVASGAKPSPEGELKTGAESLAKGKEFTNLIIGERDSVWQSTEDTFRLYRSQLGYDPAKDGDITAWARKKTAEVMHELSEKEYKGKGVPDVVHDNDKIAVYIGEDGKPHLRFEESSGIKSGYLEKAEAAPKITEEPKHPVEIPPDKGPYQPPEAEAKTQIIPEKPAIETPQAEPAPKPENPLKEDPEISRRLRVQEIEPRPNPLVEDPEIARKLRMEELVNSETRTPWENFKSALESIQKPEDETRRDEAIAKYLLGDDLKETIRASKFSPEKIRLFAKMFNTADVEGLRPENLSGTLRGFDGELRMTTQKLIDGEINDALRMAPQEIKSLPLEGKDGSIFVADNAKGGKWALLRIYVSPNGSLGASGYIEKGGFLGREKSTFSFEEVRRILGYNSAEEIQTAAESPLPGEKTPNYESVPKPHSNIETQETEKIPESEPAKPETQMEEIGNRIEVDTKNIKGTVEIQDNGTVRFNVTAYDIDTNEILKEGWRGKIENPDRVPFVQNMARELMIKEKILESIRSTEPEKAEILGESIEKSRDLIKRSYGDILK
jgi:hypothetical protein